MRVNLKTFDEKLSKDTIQSHQNTIQRYIELFGDHQIDKFPKNLSNKFRQLAPTLTTLTDTKKPLSDYRQKYGRSIEPSLRLVFS